MQRYRGIFVFFLATLALLGGLSTEQQWLININHFVVTGFALVASVAVVAMYLLVQRKLNTFQSTKLVHKLTISDALTIIDSVPADSKQNLQTFISIIKLALNKRLLTGVLLFLVAINTAVYIVNGFWFMTVVATTYAIVTFIGRSVFRSIVSDSEDLLALLNEAETLVNTSKHSSKPSN